jgi:predicted permease
MARHPAVTGVIFLTLALGVGANTAVFSFYFGIVLRSLPYRDAGHVAVVRANLQNTGDLGISPADFLDLQEQNRTLDGLAAFTAEVGTLTGQAEPGQVFCANVTSNYFSVLEAPAEIGRVFLPADCANAGARVAVISDRFWRSQFGGRKDALGRVLVLNGVSFTVVGVMPPEFQYPRWVDAWLSPSNGIPSWTIGWLDVPRTERNDEYLDAVCRLKPGVPLAAAASELTAIARRLPSRFAAKTTIDLTDIREETYGDVRSTLKMLLACAGLVLLIACLNVANLQLAQSTGRRKEIAVRTALGAGRWRLVRQFLAENFVLGVIGGSIGIAVAYLGVHLLVGIAPGTLPRIGEVRLDGRVLAFAACVSALAGIVFGSIPAFHASGLATAGVLKENDRGASGRRHRTRGAIVTAEVALSLVLLVAAMLLFKSFRRMLDVDLGMNVQDVVSERVSFTGRAYSEPARRRAFYRSFLDRAGAEPGFGRIGLSYDQPLGGSWMNGAFAIEGMNVADPSRLPPFNGHIVSPGFFAAVGARLVEGRLFTEADNETSRLVVIINESLARRFFPGGSALGKRVKTNFGLSSQWREIVGVVADVKYDGPEAPADFQIFRPYLQAPGDSFFVDARTSLTPREFESSLRRIVRSLDPALPISSLNTLNGLDTLITGSRRFLLVLIEAFAATALILAAVGIYAVVAQGVAERTREFGIRIALGAQPGAVVRLVVRQGLVDTGFGIAIGLGGAAAAAVLFRRLLFGVVPLDPATFSAVPLLLGAIMLLASFLPARRAARVDPMISLRAE